MSFSAIKRIPRDFIMRRLHSLAGMGIVVFLMSHLFTNSRAALWFGDDGAGFIDSVNAIHAIPFLPLLEVVALAIPILIHLVWGIHYVFTAKVNSFASDGSAPSLSGYTRNKAYTWQRITSWILAVGIIAHVVHMRFVEYPTAYQEGHTKEYAVRVSGDSGLPSLAKRLDVKLYDAAQAANSRYAITLKEGELLAVAPDFGTADLLVVRDTFKMPLMIALYTLLVVAACFHAFNGLSTFLITWGVTITGRSQTLVSYLSIGLMTLFSFFGLSAIWLTYWINLKS